MTENVAEKMTQAPVAGRRRRLLLVGTALAGVLLGLVLLASVLGGDSAEVVAEVPRRAAPAAVPVPTLPEEAPPAVGVGPVAPDGPDPFRQVVTPPANPSAVGAQSASGAQPAGGQPAATPSTLPAGGGGGSPAAAPAAPTAPEKAALELTAIAGDDAGVERAHITVDGKPYRPAKGEVFSFGFPRLEQIDGRCVEVSSGQDKVQMCLPPAA